MATVYEVEIVSHWTNYTKEELKRLLEQAIQKEDELKMYGNEITVKVKERH